MCVCAQEWSERGQHAHTGAATHSQHRRHAQRLAQRARNKAGRRSKANTDTYTYMHTHTHIHACTHLVGCQRRTAKRRGRVGARGPRVLAPVTADAAHIQRQSGLARQADSQPGRQTHRHTFTHIHTHSHTFTHIHTHSHKTGFSLTWSASFAKSTSAPSRSSSASSALPSMHAWYCGTSSKAHNKHNMHNRHNKQNRNDIWVREMHGCLKKGAFGMRREGGGPYLLDALHIHAGSSPAAVEVMQFV